MRTQELEPLFDCRTLLSLLCDAISVLGNDLYKYQEHTCKLITKSAQFEGTIFF
jgi:nucleolar pre-ribosomal-associated protein 1